MRILKELQCHFLGKNTKILDLRNIKELASVLGVRIPGINVARKCYFVK